MSQMRPCPSCGTPQPQSPLLRPTGVALEPYTLPEFQRDTARTWADPNPDYELIAALGLAGEAGEALELCLVASSTGSTIPVHSLTSELGDVLHYAVALARHHGWEAAAFDLEAAETRMATQGRNLDEYSLGAFVRLSVAAGKVADQVKKHRFHGHPLDEAQLQANLADVIAGCKSLGSLFSIGLREMMLKNVNKQRRRFPDGFSAEASIARVDQAG